ncbi:MAG: pantoate--beta-alanine ligase [Deltaproteobacteria bacterium]|nr:pantoate--beta-alanine ligase [Deltaproteobacteria bacterium]
MKIAQTIPEMKAFRKELAGPVGFVPTMGFLHEGHLSLVRRARAENASVAVSIFVNPTQFGPGEDLATYPRNLERDRSFLEQEGADLVFTPSPEEMYPPGFQTWVEAEKISERLEGACRPGHFRGVATVVLKLFHLVGPDRAYFGQKDAQQALVIRRMAADLNLDVESIVVPTVREEDGLAMSSRNVRLDPPGRRAAPILFQALSLARQLYGEGERDAERIRRRMAERIGREPLVRIEYVSLADRDTLEELSILDRPALASLAAHIGPVRLIDNLLLP